MEDDKKWKDQQRKHLGQVLEPRLIKSGMHPVGRLDYDTTGLILFSLDGKLTQQLLHPRRGVQKEYVATVQGLADEAVLTQKLSDGVKTSEGVHKAKLIAVTPSDGPVGDQGAVREERRYEDAGGQGEYQSELEEIMGIGEEEEEDGPMDGGELEESMGIEEEDDEEWQADYSGPYSDVRLVVSEGKYRMVRRMLANCGHPVVELRRLRLGNIELGDLKVGEFREANDEELEWAQSLINK